MSEKVQTNLGFGLNLFQRRVLSSAGKLSEHPNLGKYIWYLVKNHPEIKSQIQVMIVRGVNENEFN